jgi:hypothetical protein
MALRVCAYSTQGDIFIFVAWSPVAGPVAGSLGYGVRSLQILSLCGRWLNHRHHSNAIGPPRRADQNTTHGPRRGIVYKYWPLDREGQPFSQVRHISPDGEILLLIVTMEQIQVLRSLTRRLTAFPLALATAGAFLKQTSVDCTAYLQRYEEVWQITRTPVSQPPECPTRTRAK